MELPPQIRTTTHPHIFLVHAFEKQTADRDNGVAGLLFRVPVLSADSVVYGLRLPSNVTGSELLYNGIAIVKEVILRASPGIDAEFIGDPDATEVQSIAFFPTSLFNFFWPFVHNVSGAWLSNQFLLVASCPFPLFFFVVCYKIRTRDSENLPS